MSRVYRDGRLVGDWHRHYPTANTIALEILARRDLLRLRTRLLKQDIREKFGVCDGTAGAAVAIARRLA